jgi:small subunit ribosomal protein S11
MAEKTPAPQPAPPAKPAAEAAPAKPGAEEAAAKPGAPAKKEAAKKKIKRTVPRGIIHVHATFNNTIITITDPSGATLCWTSAGTIGYKGSRKSTPYAAQKAAEACGELAQRFGMREADVKIKGPGAGRESAVRALQGAGIEIRSIEDVTPIPHNGCRPRKRRRV